jgi:hypothetical protein
MKQRMTGSSCAVWSFAQDLDGQITRYAEQYLRPRSTIRHVNAPTEVCKDRLYAHVPAASFKPTIAKIAVMATLTTSIVADTCCRQN